MCGKNLQHLQPLGKAEHRALFRIPQNAHDEFFKNLGAPLNQIEVPVGGRIERTGIKRADFVQWSSQEAVVPNTRFYAGSTEYGNSGMMFGRIVIPRETRALSSCLRCKALPTQAIP